MYDVSQTDTQLRAELATLRQRLTVLETSLHHPVVETFANRVSRVLAKSSRGGSHTAEDMARQLGVSVRTLRRRLREEGVSYQDLLDEMRHNLAQRYLMDRYITISEVAFELGFSDTSGFHRAFKRWTGVSPGHYRQHRLAPCHA